MHFRAFSAESLAGLGDDSLQPALQRIVQVKVYRLNRIWKNRPFGLA